MLFQVPRNTISLRKEIPHYCDCGGKYNRRHLAALTSSDGKKDFLAVQLRTNDRFLACQTGYLVLAWVKCWECHNLGILLLQMANVIIGICMYHKCILNREIYNKLGKKMYIH